MSRIRVVLADLSPMLTSLITELIHGPQVEVIGGRSGGDLAALVAESGASVVILPGDGTNLSEAGRRLLDDRSRLRVVALPEYARTGVIGSLSVRTVGLEDISKASLLEAVVGELDLGDGDRSDRDRGVGDRDPDRGGAAP